MRILSLLLCLAFVGAKDCLHAASEAEASVPSSPSQVSGAKAEAFPLPERSREEIHKAIKDWLPDFRAKTQSDFQWEEVFKAGVDTQMLETFDRQNDRANFFPAVLIYLVENPQDENFGKWLWRAAIYAEWMTHLSTIPRELGVDMLLGRLASQWNDSPWRQEGIFLFSRLLRQKNEFAQARGLLLSAVAEKECSDTFKITFYKALSEIAEAQKNREEAIEFCSQGSVILPSHPLAAKLCVRAFWLEISDKAEGGLLEENLQVALKHLAPLKEVELEVQMMESPMLHGVLSEAIMWAKNTELARQSWGRYSKWKTIWDAAAPDLGVPVQFIPRMPPLENATLWAEGAIAHLSQGNSHEFLKQWSILAHAGMISPVFAVEAGMLVLPAVNALPMSHLNRLQTLLLAMLEGDMILPEVTERRRSLVLGTLYYQTGKYAEGLKVVEDFGSKAQVEDTLSQAIRRLYGLLVLRSGGDLAAPVALLEEGLKSKVKDPDRASSVTVLAELYRAAGRIQDELSLLEVELKDPLIKNSNTYGDLSRRYGALTVELMESTQFHDTVTRWFELQNFDWYPHVSPKSLDDPRYSKLDGITHQSEEGLSKSERVKYHFLIALKPAHSLAQRKASFSQAIKLLVELEPHQSRVLQWIDSILNEESFPQDIRAYMIWMAMGDAVNHRQIDSALKWANHPASSWLNPQQRAVWVPMETLAKTGLQKVEDMLAQARSYLRSSHSLSKAEISVLNGIFQELLLRRELKKAQELLQGLEGISFEAGVGDGTRPEELKFEWGRWLNLAKLQYSFQEKVTSAILSAFPAEQRKVPEALSELRSLSELEFWSPDDAVQAWLCLLEEKKIALSSVRELFPILSALNDQNQRTEWVFEIIELVLREAPTDLDRSLLMLFSPAWVDVDDEKIQTRLLSLFKTWIQEYDETFSIRLTRDAFAMIETELELRKGNREVANRIESRYRNLSHPFLSRSKMASSFAASRILDDPQVTESVLLENSSQDLLSISRLPDTLVALEELAIQSNLKDVFEELNREAKNVATKTIHDILNDTWISPDPIRAEAALRVACVIRDPKLLESFSDAWLNKQLKKARHPRLAARLQIQHARLKGNWEAQRHFAQQALKHYPTYYHFHWDLAEALLHLNREQEAASWLDSFIAHACDDLEWPEAIRRRQAISKGTEASP